MDEPERVGVEELQERTPRHVDVAGPGRGVPVTENGEQMRDEEQRDLVASYGRRVLAAARGLPATAPA